MWKKLRGRSGTRGIGLLCLLFLAGCAIHQQVNPAPRLDTREICVIKNADVREGFLNAYRNALGAKGFQVRVLDESALPGDCPLASTYTANWRWDLTMYMAFAEIKVYAGGKEVGSALYDSLGGGGNLKKFIRAETKINELVDELFRNYSPGSDGA